MSKALLITPRDKAMPLFIPQVVAAATNLAAATNYLAARFGVKMRIFAASVNVRTAVDAVSTTAAKFAFRVGTAVNNNTPQSFQYQVETATAAGTITGTGNATVVVTGTALSGSPVTVSVAVSNTDTAATWAGLVRTALAANAAIAAAYNVGGSTTAITLTAKERAANDSTLNISLDNGTCTGITTAATSANTTAGIAPSAKDAIGERMVVLPSYYGSEQVDQGDDGFVLEANQGLWVRCLDTGSTVTPPAGLDVSLVVGFA
jgi:hypothetical protein